MNGEDLIRVALQDALAAGQGDHPVHVLGESLELSPATCGLAGRWSDRCHLLPASDATLTGLAVGLALAGARPVVELPGVAALWGALQQVGQEAARARGAFRLRMVVRVPFAPDEDPLSVPLVGVDGLTVASPSCPVEADQMLRAALRAEGPVVLLEPRLALSHPGPTALEPLPLERARRLRTGARASVLAWGDGVAPARAAAEQLDQEGIAVDLIDLRCLHPLDEAAIAGSVNETGRLTVVGGPDTALLTALRGAFLRLESPPRTATADTAGIVVAVRESVGF